MKKIWIGAWVAIIVTILPVFSLGMVGLALDINSLEELEDFQREMEVLEGISYLDEKEFLRELDLIFKKNDVLYDGENISLHRFMDLFYLGSHSILYRVDVNNDGLDDIVLTSNMVGTGNFSYIDCVFLGTDNKYIHKEILDQPGINRLTFIEHKGKTYLYTSSHRVDRIYSLERDTLTLMFDEMVFVDNSHLEADTRELDQEIAEIYEVDRVVEELIDEGVDFSLITGLSNRDLLITFYKIKDFIATGNVQGLAEMIYYPQETLIDGETIKVYNPGDFVDRHEAFLHEELVEAVLTSEPNDIFVSWQGAMIGGGVLWFLQSIFVIR